MLNSVSEKLEENTLVKKENYRLNTHHLEFNNHNSLLYFDY